MQENRFFISFPDSARWKKHILITALSLYTYHAIFLLEVLFTYSLWKKIGFVYFVYINGCHKK